MKKALVVAAIFLGLVTGVVVVALNWPRPARMAGRPEVDCLRSAKECEAFLDGQKEGFKLSPEQIAQLAEIASTSVIDARPCGWKFDGQLVGTCRSGGNLHMACSARGDFLISCCDGKQELCVYGKTTTKPSIYDYLKQCQGIRAKPGEFPD